MIKNPSRSELIPSIKTSQSGFTAFQEGSTLYHLSKSSIMPVSKWQKTVQSERDCYYTVIRSRISSFPGVSGLVEKVRKDFIGGK